MSPSSVFFPLLFVRVKFIAVLPLLILAGCDNPGGISNEEYQAYKKLGAPKILYSCEKIGLKFNPNILSECLKINDFSKDGLEKQSACAKRAEREAIKPVVNVGYVAGIGAGVTYNKLVSDAEKECEGKFEILDGRQ